MVVNITDVEIQEIVVRILTDAINKQMEFRFSEMENSIRKFFSEWDFSNTKTQFERALYASTEGVFQAGISLAMEELNFKELVAKEAKKVLSDEAFIRSLAEKKVRASLGLPME